ncbi:peroxisomal membrane protein PEX16 [Nephila pilipes]|uniref:Peroxisomal membrane protein PEX16 n=1 Tax=Nephila pilipes TaxID=299642 RepID=A0A8X6Q4Y8_NEPPI|nr:peroxisomal membrane protein PEX16 [Nephila pilipes]
MAVNYREYFEKYTYFVTNNPLLANEVEVALKWASYIIAGRFSQSPVVTELVHSSSKLLTLLNDNILRRAAGIPINVDVTVEKLSLFLTIIEYSEVFAEVATNRIFGSRGKWLTVLLLHLVKFAVQLLLLLKYDQGLHHSPPIPPLNRKKDVPELCKQSGNTEPLPENYSNSNVQVTFTLKTSGRVVRTVNAAPPLVSRSWQLPKIDEENYKASPRSPSKLSGKFLSGEILHIVRPLVHLASMGAFGEFSWKPFFIAMGMDVTSLHLLKQKHDFNKAEKLEINRRALSLFLYLLRSPFYNRYSKQRIINILQSTSDRIIGSGLLLRPLIEYIPEWQQQYFYAWSS